MLLGENITENSVFESDGNPNVNKSSGSADLLRRNMYSINEIGQKRAQNLNSNSIQDLQSKNTNNIIIQGKDDSRSAARRQIGANSALDIKKGGNHATLVVRN